MQINVVSAQLYHLLRPHTNWKLFHKFKKDNLKSAIWIFATCQKNCQNGIKIYAIQKKDGVTGT